MIASGLMWCYLVPAVLLADAESDVNDPFAGSTEVVRYTFDDPDELDLLPGLWQPRNWTRRKGREFPSYVRTGIDRRRGFGGSRYSLRFDVNGGQAITYSPPVRIDGLHTYVFEGYVRTQLLLHDAALVSVSFLNQKRQRVQRFLSRPVSGTHRDWVRVRIGPMRPQEDVQFAVIGCHLVHGKEMDIGGAAWFDQLYLGRVPQLTLQSNYYTHFRQRSAPIETRASVSGLDLDRLFSAPLDEAGEGNAASAEKAPSPLTAGDLDELSEGTVSERLRQVFSANGHPLKPEVQVKRDGNRRWLLASGSRRYLLFHKNDRSLAVRDPDTSYELHLRILDERKQLIAETSFPLVAYHSSRNLLENIQPSTRRTRTWRLGPQEYGYYRVQAALKRQGAVILRQQTSFAVMDLSDRVRPSEFGWSFSREVTKMSARELADVAAQGGINWVKHPVWRSAFAEDPSRVVHVAEIFDRLVHRGITPVGVLAEPPVEIRNKFPANWSGVAEIFALPRQSWAPWLEPVIGRYSSGARHWQLGGETDASFIGMDRLPETLSAVKREFDRIGRNTRIGIRWNWNAPLPSRREMPHVFLSIDGRPAQQNGDPERQDETGDRSLSADRLREQLLQTADSDIPRWVLIRPLSRRYPPEQRKADLVKRMVAAKAGGAEAIFAVDVLHDDYGLLSPIGSPNVLFLPWRTAATAFGGTEFLGSLRLPGGSRNYVFARDGEAVMFIWNDEPVTERVYLGDGRNVVVFDLSGGQFRPPVDPDTRRQRIEVTSVPQIVRGCSEAVARWRLAAGFEQPRFPAATGRHENALVGRNTFPQGVAGRATIHMPAEWKAEPDRWEVPLSTEEDFRLPMILTIPSNTSLDGALVAIDFEIDARIQHNFRVYRPIRMGVGDVSMKVVDRKLPGGRLAIEQVMVNRTDPPEILSFECSLFVPGQRRQKKLIPKLRSGERQKKEYFLPDAEAMRGQELWLRAEQVGGRRVLNHRWRIGESWDEQ